MSKEKLGAGDYRFIAICLALLGATTWFSARNFHRAFPEASIDFRITREGGRALAERLLAAQQYKLAGYRQASSFTYDDDAKTFLEREAGPERANQLMGGRIRLWRWSYRWFRPQQKEEFLADLTPSGDWAGFAHVIAEDAARPDVDSGQARALAEDFLRSRMHRDPAGLEFVEAVEVVRPHRTDRTFTWKERDFNLHDATYRLAVTTLGNEVGAYREYLKVPENWTRDYQRLRSKNDIAQTVDMVFMMALVVGLVIVIVMRIRRHDIRWRRAAFIGVAGMALSFCAHLNSFPLYEFSYATTDSYVSFLSQKLLEGILSALGAGGLLFVLAAGAEPVYREAYPSQLSLGGLFRPRGLRTRRFFKGVILGLTLTGIFICYQVVFYMVAYRFGAWSPVDVPYDNLLNTKFPWLFVLFGGYLPAVSEEFLFRMFAIPFLRKLVRWLPAALVLAGFIWGFGHAGYAQQPFYIRGLEVGIGGVALGIIMLRWGILPTLVWHYSVDAMYTAMLMLRSHSFYFRLSGAASAGILVLPVVVALVAYWRRGGFEPETGLLNGDEPDPDETAIEVAPAVVAEPGGSYQPLSARRRVAALVVCAAGLAALAIPVARFGDKPKLRLSAAEARGFADRFLRQQGLDPAKFRHVTSHAVHWGGDDSFAAKYFLERLPVAAASRLFDRNRPMHFWGTRYYRSLDQEELFVTVDPETGKILGYSHTLPEDRAGADLGEDAARAIAERFASVRGLDVSAMDLKENTSEKKKARRDYMLVWEARAADPRNVADAHYRISIGVSGDAVSSWRCFWKIPEAFARARLRENWVSISVKVMSAGVLTAGFVWGLVLMIQTIRKGRVPWGIAITLAAPATLLYGLARLLEFDQTFMNYPTAIPIETFQATVYMGMLVVLLAGILVLGGAAALLASQFPEALEAFRSAGRRSMGADAVLAALAGAGLAIAAGRVSGLMHTWFHGQAVFDISASGLATSAVPALGAISGSVSRMLVLAAAFAVFVTLARWLPRGFWIAAALLALTLGLSTDIRTPAEWLLAYGSQLVFGAALALFVLLFARRNPLAYAVALWGMVLGPKAAELLGTTNAALVLQGWIVAGVLAAGVVWVAIPAVIGKPNTARASA
jgi:membrane protease YdiL (CAAX protease family)